MLSRPHPRDHHCRRQCVSDDRHDARVGVLMSDDRGHRPRIDGMPGRKAGIQSAGCALEAASAIILERPGAVRHQFHRLGGQVAVEQGLETKKTGLAESIAAGLRSDEVEPGFQQNQSIGRSHPRGPIADRDLGR